jgi:hypothetical protein
VKRCDSGGISLRFLVLLLGTALEFQIQAANPVDLTKPSGWKVLTASAISEGDYVRRNRLAIDAAIQLEEMQPTNPLFEAALSAMREIMASEHFSESTKLDVLGVYVGQLAKGPNAIDRLSTLAAEGIPKLPAAQGAAWRTLVAKAQDVSHPAVFSSFALAQVRKIFDASTGYAQLMPAILLVLNGTSDIAPFQFYLEHGFGLFMDQWKVLEISPYLNPDEVRNRDVGFFQRILLLGVLIHPEFIDALTAIATGDEGPKSRSVARVIEVARQSPPPDPCALRLALPQIYAKAVNDFLKSHLL